MKKIWIGSLLVFSVLLLFLMGFAFAQGDIVHEASRLTWDHDRPEMVEEYRMYCHYDPSFVPSSSTLVTTILAPTNEWVITLVPGHWYCVVTAYAIDFGESPPSNIWEGTVIRWIPKNLRKKTTSTTTTSTSTTTTFCYP